MALTWSYASETVAVVGDGATAIDLVAVIGKTGVPINLKGMSYYPASGGGGVTVRDGDANGPIIWKVKSSAITDDRLGEHIMFPVPKLCRPYVVGNEIDNGGTLTFHL